MDPFDIILIAPMLGGAALALLRPLRRGVSTPRSLAAASIGGALGGVLTALLVNIGTDPDLTSSLARCIPIGALLGGVVGLIVLVVRAGVRARRRPDIERAG